MERTSLLSCYPFSFELFYPYALNLVPDTFILTPLACSLSPISDTYLYIYGPQCLPCWKSFWLNTIFWNLFDQTIVSGVIANPKPSSCVTDKHAQRSISEANPKRPDVGF